MRDDLELRLTAWLEDGPVRASDAFVDATFAPVPHLRRRRGWQARLGSLLGAGLSIPAGRVMRLAMVGALALLILSVVAFGGGGLMQPAPSPTPPPAPRVMFTLTTDRLPTRTFHEVANPGLDTCVTLGDAPWRLIYAGGSEPFISLDVVV